MGFAFDGFPIYGPYGYANVDGSGGVARIRTGYRMRSITTRTTLPNGTVLTSAQYGPAVSTTYPLGYYLEDFEYIAGLGDLDTSNGRFCVTPEYPMGTYCYFTTIDASGHSEYPYTVGPTYYGVVATDNTNHTVSVPTSGVTTLDPCSIGLSISMQPSATRACRAGTAVMIMGASGTGGSGPFTYQWRRNTANLVDSAGRISGSTSPMLTIYNCLGSDTGDYDCIATSACTSQTTNAAHLNVCVGDYSCDGTINVQDIFDFLAGWFAGAPAADTNGVGGITVQDIFDFLAAWFTGC
jgi:hypothetical protein